MTPARPDDFFGPRALALAGGLSVRNIQHLSEAGMELDRDVRALKRVAFIGALVSVGLNLVLAGNVALALAGAAFNTVDGEAPSGLDGLARALSETPLGFLNEPNDWSYHSQLRRRPDLYVPGRALRSDAVIEIADRRYVFLRAHKGPQTLGGHGGEAQGRIEGWARGTEAVFFGLWDVLPAADELGHAAALSALEAEFAAARENAIGLLSVNVSLAVRNAFDRVADAREARRE